MLTIFIIMFALVSVALIFFVLLQVPKQAGLSSSLGGGGDLFGGRGVEGGLVRISSVLGGLFMLLALLIDVLSR
ncbi:preprotein translocase subunit SecG [Deinococcus aquiradiocola]|uniref:Protein-export membrane protein SecG n=1 Tax=Deinococcus aquiradiocola TaxID=393059 RepID=A0A917P633_9DEIO|nr:preprotein translocase subunit SecG [Deinococcus aquiradiocola]GGJ63341.1 preprotein translocase subunit SecG [Deinococcus aquiradiocola]